VQEVTAALSAGPKCGSRSQTPLEGRLSGVRAAQWACRSFSSVDLRSVDLPDYTYWLRADPASDRRIGALGSARVGFPIGFPEEAPWISDDWFCPGLKRKPLCRCEGISWHLGVFWHWTVDCSIHKRVTLLHSIAVPRLLKFLLFAFLSVPDCSFCWGAHHEPGTAVQLYSNISACDRTVRMFGSIVKALLPSFGLLSFPFLRHCDLELCRRLQFLYCKFESFHRRCAQQTTLTR